MTVEVSTLQVKVMSDGIKEATDGLNSLVKAATEAESKSVILKSATEDVSKSQGASASAADKLLKKFQETVDLLGANTEKTYSYKAASKGLSDEQQTLAGQLGSQVDAYRALLAQQREAEKQAKASARAEEEYAKAQAQAIEMNKKYDLRQAAAEQKELNAQRGEAERQARAAAQAEEEYARAQGQAIEMNKRYDRRKQAQEWKELGMAQAEATRMNREYDAELARTAATTARVDRQQRDFIATLKDQATTAGMTASELTAYRAAQLGVAAQAAPYVAKLKEMEKANNLTGVSAKQAAFAFKMLPAQMSDITVQLAGGQNPFLVLLQQGSQIKDSFGGLSNTFKALTGAITPTIIAMGGLAAGIAAIGYGIYSGSKQFEDFNKALILTNSYSGLNNERFAQMSTELGKIAGGRNNAAEALIAIADSGQIASQNVAMVGKAAVQMQEATGQAVEKTIAQFVAIQKDPVKAVTDLNDKYHFLTLEIYNQINALEDQGKTQEAATVAANAYADAIAERAPKVIENLGYIEKAWKGIKDVAKEAMSSLSDIGRTQTYTDQIAALQKRIETNNAMYKNSPQATRDLMNQPLLDQIDVLQSDKRRVESEQQKQDAFQKTSQEAIKAAEQIDKALDKIKGPDKLAKDIAKVRAEFDKIYKANANDERVKGVYSESGEFTGGGAYKTIVDELKRKDIRKTPTNEYGIDAQLKQLAGTLEEEKRLLDRNNISTKNSYDVGIINLREYLAQEYDLKAESLREQKSIVEGQIEIAKGKKNLAAVEKYKNDLSKLQDEIYKNGEDYNAKVKKADADEKSRVQTYLDGLKNVVENRRKEIENMSIGAGLGDRQREDMKRALKIQEEYQTQLQALNKKFPESRRGDSEYQSELAGLKDQLGARLKLEEDYKNQRLTLESDWQAGAKDAWQNYLDSTKDVAGQTKTLFTDVFSGLEDALTNFVTTGKLSFGDFAKTIIAQLIKMQLAAAATGLFNMFTGGTAASAATSTVADSSNLAGAFAADGAVFNNGASTRYFADGGAFTNGIVSSPTNFDIGQMGEAGPEAIVPLTKTSDGSLGVTMKGVGGGDNGPVAVHNNITINNDGSASATSSTVGSQQEQAKAFSQVMENVAKQTIYKEMQQGGSLWKMKNGQR